MRWIALPFSPLLWVLLTAGLFSIQLGLEQTLRLRQLELQEVKGAFELAITQSQSTLSSKLFSLASDAALSQNLSWGLSNSVRSALAGRLSPGELDHLSIYSDTCNELFQAGKPSSTPCESIKKVALSGGGIVSTPKDSADSVERLTASFRMGEGFIVGDVLLDSSWLARQGNLKSLIDHAGLLLNNQKTQGRSALIITAKGGLALVTKEPLDHFFPVSSKNKEFQELILHFHNPLLWPSLFALCLCAGLAIAQSYLNEKRLLQFIFQHSKQLESLKNKILRTVSTIKPSSFPQPSFKDLKKSPEIFLVKTQQSMEEAFLSKTQAQREIEEKHEDALNQIQLLQSEIIQLKTKLKEQEGFASLASQLKTATAPFLHRLARLDNLASQLKELTQEKLVKTGINLKEQIEIWNASISERGARKFLRSLSELPSEKDKNISALDEEIRSLLLKSQRLHDLAIKTNLTSQLMIKETEEASKLAKHWEALASGAASSDQNISLWDAFCEAKTLALCSGLNLPDFDIPKSACAWPELPARSAVSALFHLLSVLSEWQELDTKIVCRMRKEAQHHLWIFSMTLSETSKNIPRSPHQTQHLETAKNLLAPHGVGLGFLPTRSGLAPIALRWEETLTASSPEKNSTQHPKFI